MKKLTRVCETSEPAQRIVSFTAEIMGGFCVIAHALVLALQAWHLEHDHSEAHDHMLLPPEQTTYLR